MKLRGACPHCCHLLLIRSVGNSHAFPLTLESPDRLRMTQVLTEDSTEGLYFKSTPPSIEQR